MRDAPPKRIEKAPAGAFFMGSRKSLAAMAITDCAAPPGTRNI
jgi:hypothetical protein